MSFQAIHSKSYLLQFSCYRSSLWFWWFYWRVQENQPPWMQICELTTLLVSSRFSIFKMVVIIIKSTIQKRLVFEPLFTFCHTQDYSNAKQALINVSRQIITQLLSIFCAHWHHVGEGGREILEQYTSSAPTRDFVFRPHSHSGHNSDCLSLR